MPAASWSRWARTAPSRRVFGVDGYRWLRNHVPIEGADTRRFIPTAADAGSRLSCEETVTYPPPFLLTVSATSDPVEVG